MVTTLDSTQVQPHCMYKFVRANGKYRFLEVNGLASHKDMVQDGETVDAAGVITVSVDYWTLWESYSASLKVHCGDKAVEDISTLLGLPERTPPRPQFDNTDWLADLSEKAPKNA